MKNIWIAGASGFGREVYCWIKDMLKAGCCGQARIAGFLDSPVCASKPGSVLSLLGEDAAGPEIKVLEDFIPGGDDFVACGFGEPKTKARLIPVLMEKGVKLFSVIHPTAVVGVNVQIGDGAVLLPYVTVSTNVKIGICCLINGGACTVGHDVTIGDYCTLSPGAHILGGAKIGSRVWLADHSIVLPHAVVEDDVKIGAASVVVRRARSCKTYMGNPAVALFDY